MACHFRPPMGQVMRWDLRAPQVSNITVVFHCRWTGRFVLLSQGFGTVILAHMPSKKVSVFIFSAVRSE
jgi:hypothetical protein